MATQFERFQRTLRQLFMLDHADLDFGIYRIMNQKREEIDRYLNFTLPRQVKTLLTENTSAHVEELQKKLNDTIAQIQSLGYDADTNPKVIALREELANSGSSKDLEDMVYSHLATFFSRYYEGGDFISLRRYKKDVYAIPYEGEEVKLHWANADQYYIKTGEYFRTYSFKLDDEKRIDFTLKEASTEQNNNLAQNNMERRFAIYEETPVCVEGNTLHINFTYELYPKATKQKDLITRAYEVVKPIIPSAFSGVFAPRPTDSDRNRTLLQKHFNDYVARNTFDYFIHKDLHGFLSRELDFYIKNEILVIDDIDARSTEEFLSHLTIIKAIKAVGASLIQFLSQLEEYQKRLWLKKKFVVQADYCITLDRVPEELYAEICANDAQREEWVRLFAIDEIIGDGLFKTGYTEPLTEKFLQENPFLVLDTVFFSKEFKQQLISSIDNLDEQCDGLMINSENFQALQLLQEKYNQQINTIYIDPPYNAKSSQILYKNTFKHSAWNSLINDRVIEGYKLLDNKGILEFAIDDYEVKNSLHILSQIFGEENFMGNICVQHNPRGRNDDKFFGTSHEYMTVYGKNAQDSEIGLFKMTEADAAAFNRTDGVSNYTTVSFMRTGNNSRRFERPNLFYPIYVNPENLTLSLQNHPGWIEILPISPDGEEKTWRWEQSTFLKKYETEIEVKYNNGSYRLYKKRRLTGAGKKPKTTWIDSKYDASSHGIMLMVKLFGSKDIFSYPKSIDTVKDALFISTDIDSLVLDFFAGSGTTGHAVIELNREEEEEVASRKYVLVEMGTYFDTATKPRIQKVIYSEDWNNGKPVSRKGSSHCFKYMRLEQYEDTLNNLILSQNSIENSSEYYDGFLLGYMLDMETKDSLFNLDWFVNPFDMKLRITRNNETIEENVDLIETFNYLIGLNVAKISYPKKGICVVEGITRRGKKTLVIWRDCNKINNQQLNDFFSRSAYSVRDNEYDTIYVNGDNNLDNLRTDEENWKVMLIEQEFNKQMFNN